MLTSWICKGVWLGICNGNSVMVILEQQLFERLNFEWQCSLKIFEWQCDLKICMGNLKNGSAIEKICYGCHCKLFKWHYHSTFPLININNGCSKISIIEFTISKLPVHFFQIVFLFQNCHCIFFTWHCHSEITIIKFLNDTAVPKLP